MSERDIDEWVLEDWVEFWAGFYEEDMKKEKETRSE